VARPVEYKNINWRRKRRIALCSVFLWTWRKCSSSLGKMAYKLLCIY
jgi:hypothetical protein